MLALLRGLNVGGRNRVTMDALREAFAASGARDVRTYIASGNVLFAGLEGPELAGELDVALSRHLELELKVVLVTAAELSAIVDGAPDEFGSPDDRCDVVFVRPPLTAARVFARLDPREGIDRAWLGDSVVYHARRAARASGSRFGRITGYPEYAELTIRSWTTTTTLRAMFDAHEREVA